MLLAKGPALVTDITGKYGDRHADRMSDFLCEQGYSPAGQKIIGQAHADGPGLRYGDQVHQNEKEGRTMHCLPALPEYKQFGQYEGGGHSGKVGADYRGGKLQPVAIDDSGAEIDRRGGSAGQ